MMMSTKIACRESIHVWVSKRIRAVLKEGFHIFRAKAYCVKGMVHKSLSHELFFKEDGEGLTIFEYSFHTNSYILKPTLSNHLEIYCSSW